MTATGVRILKTSTVAASCTGYMAFWGGKEFNCLTVLGYKRNLFVYEQEEYQEE